MRLSYVRQALLPAVGLVLVVATWALSVAIWNISSAVLPSPADVGGALYRGWMLGLLLPHIEFTLSASLGGAAIGCAIGFVLGTWVGESSWGNRFVYPVIAGFQAMPIIAIAPLLMVWFGLGIESKLALVALSCIAPVSINTAAGVRSTNPALLDLYRAYGASRMSTLLHVKLPCALDYIFSGLQIALVLSFINCVVGEFIASQRGLGYLIKTYAGQLEVSMMFAAILSLAVMGAVTSGLLRRLHRRIVHWSS